ncbi:hypothetical protein [Vibrio mediterranei]|uniref:Lipoprotein n=1 Tax=Vibrio mediterranei TaxID=689 RepID=A0ABX5D658_9VIBR|nr:hypothetical protein [Vibrio mediterranei]PRQ65127.1 hypothetical protein COR51_23690 [Vibrio mediterranei]
MRLLLLVFVVFVMMGCGQVEPENAGFQDPNYLQIRQRVERFNPMTTQFCLNGAAFILAEMPEYAEQYQGNYGNCIERLVLQQKSLGF